MANYSKIAPGLFEHRSNNIFWTTAYLGKYNCRKLKYEVMKTRVKGGAIIRSQKKYVKQEPNV